MALTLTRPTARYDVHLDRGGDDHIVTRLAGEFAQTVGYGEPEWRRAVAAAIIAAVFEAVVEQGLHGEDR